MIFLKMFLGTKRLPYKNDVIFYLRTNHRMIYTKTSRPQQETMNDVLWTTQKTETGNGSKPDTELPGEQKHRSAMSELSPQGYRKEMEQGGR